MPASMRGLREVEPGGVDAEIVAGRRLDAVRAVAEVGDVEIPLQDLVLGEALLQADGVAQFAQFAAGGGFEGAPPLGGRVRHLGERVLDVLLGQRRPALDDRPGTQVGDHGAYGPLDVEGAVFVEPAVLDRDDRLAHDRGDLRERHLDAILVVERGQFGAVGGEDHRSLRQRGRDEVGGERLEPAVGGAYAQPAHECVREHKSRGQHARDETDGRQVPEPRERISRFHPHNPRSSPHGR